MFSRAARRRAGKNYSGRRSASVFIKTPEVPGGRGGGRLRSFYVFYNGKGEWGEGEFPGLEDLSGFIEAGVTIRAKDPKIEAIEEINRLISKEYVPARLPKYKLGGTKEERDAHMAALAEIEETASTPADYVDLMYYFAWWLIAEKYYTYRTHYDDLHAEMMRAVYLNAGKYDRTKGKPSTFFIMYMNNAACSYINEKVTFTTQYFASKETLINRWCREHGEGCTRENAEQIAADCGISLKTVLKVIDIKRCRRMARLQDVTERDLPYSDGVSYWECVTDTAEEIGLEEATAEILKKALSPMELECIVRWAGLNGNSPEKQKAIANDLGVGSEDVRYFLARAKKKLAKSKELRALAVERGIA